MGANVILVMKEALTYKNCEDLEKVFNKLVSQNKKSIICDMKAVSYLDSMALQLLLKMNDTMTSQGGSLKLFGLNGVCHDTFVATRLINVFNIHSDLQSVLRVDI